MAGSTVDDWRDAVWLSGHLWWHLCLPLLEKEQFDRVFDIYDARMATCDEDMVTRLMDCTSMLWRLEELASMLETDGNLLRINGCATRMTTPLPSPTFISR